MRIAITGAAGQLGTDLVRTLRSRGHAVTPLTRVEVDVTSASQMASVLTAAAPELLINCTAENRVDDCENLLTEAFTLNAFVPACIATLTRELGIPLMHFSTDYVFDGRQRTPYLESAQPHPLSAYGLSKFTGEELVRQRNEQHYLIRVMGLYGVAGSKGKGSNFVETIISRARAEGRVRVVTDQTGAPTYTRDLADGVADLIGSARPFGTYHLAAEGEVTWYEFACEIIRRLGLTAEVEPVTSADFKQRAVRPAYSVVRSEMLQPLRHWRAALTAYLTEKKHLTEPA
ncbi:MAG: dTDP-4-dehydrorhamnose reductase [Blastocatellia bacterium]